jgi:hypothetical protein
MSKAIWVAANQVLNHYTETPATEESTNLVLDFFENTSEHPENFWNHYFTYFSKSIAAVGKTPASVRHDQPDTNAA